MSETKKTSLQKAILEAREIENSAVENAKKLVEESVIPKIEDTVRETVRELEEGVTIDVGDADISISLEDGKASIGVDADKEDLEINPDSEDSEDEELDDEMNNMDMDSEDSEEENIDSEDEEDDSEEEEMDSEEEDEEEIFEVEGLNEEEEIPTDEVPAEEAPEEDLGIDMEGGDLEGGNTNFPGLEELGTKLDAILSKLDSAEIAADETELAPEEGVGEEAPEGIDAEGEVEIVDDEAPAEEAPEEAPEEELPGEDDMVSEDDFMELTFEEDNEEFDIDLSEIMDEIEIVDEDEDEEDEDNIDETGRGASHSVKRTGNRERKMQDDGHHTPVTALKENKEKAQKEAKNAELEQENKSLRESLKEYKESFKILRKQINEVQTFNAKLAYVNKLFSKGGLTNDEKVQIAEDFDKAHTAEEAKTLYNKIISESKDFKDRKTDKLRNQLKSANPAATPSTQTETLYENKEVSRMKLLAGIKKNTSEK